MGTSLIYFLQANVVDVISIKHEETNFSNYKQYMTVASDHTFHRYEIAARLLASKVPIEDILKLLDFG